MDHEMYDKIIENHMRLANEIEKDVYGGYHELSNAPIVTLRALGHTDEVIGSLYNVPTEMVGVVFDKAVEEQARLDDTAEQVYNDGKGPDVRGWDIFAGMGIFSRRWAPGDEDEE